MKIARVHPVNHPLTGSVLCARDKSLSHRAAILAALAQGTTKVSGFSFCEDCLSTLSCLRQFGVRIKTYPDVGKVVVESGGWRELTEPEDVLYAGNSGTTARLLCGVASWIKGLTIITGDASLRRRPMRRVIEPLSLTGIQIGGRDNNRFLPVFIRGKYPLTPFEYRLSVASAQVKSALLLAALGADAPSCVREPFASRDHTENMLSYLGIRLEREPGRVVIHPPAKPLKARDFSLPGDVSSAAFLAAAALMVPDSGIYIQDVGLNPTRSGFLECVSRMGGQVKIHNLKEEFGERRGDLEVAFSSLRGVSIGKEIIPSLIDEVPILSVLATQAQGVTFITGAEELRVKECDRLRAMYLGLKTLGAKVEERSDGLIIEGPVTLHGGRVESFGDHRIAMSFAVAGLIAREAVEIVDVDCVKISYPEFFDHLQSLGCKRVEFYESEEEGEKSCL